MRFNKKHFPVLKMLENKSIFDNGILKHYFFNKTMQDEFKKNHQFIDNIFKSIAGDLTDITYISQPVYEMLKSQKTNKLLDNKVNEIPEKLGAILSKDYQFIYYLLPVDKGIMFLIYAFKGDTLVEFSNGLLDINEDAIYLDDKTLTPKRCDCEQIQCDHTLVLISFILKIVTFKLFVEIETKTIKPNKKEYVNNEKIFNESKNDIQIIDMSYHTNISSEQEFKVRSHLRLQPCGKQRSKIKLTWINEFTKSGYYRKAKALSVPDYQGLH